MYKMITKWIYNGKVDEYSCISCASDKTIAKINLLQYTQEHIYNEYGLIPSTAEIFLHLEYFSKVEG